VLEGVKMSDEDLISLHREFQEFLTIYGEYVPVISAAMQAQSRLVSVLDSRITVIATILAEMDPKIRERLAASPNFGDIATSEPPTNIEGLHNQLQKIAAQLDTLMKKNKSTKRK
jgi:hypothetical protein